MRDYAKHDDEFKETCRQWWIAGFWAGAGVFSIAWVMIFLVGWWLT